MKYVLLILSFVISFTAFSQVQTDPDSDKFIGTWKWVSGSDSLILHLYKQAVHYPAPLNYDVENIIGWHKYVKNGIVTKSSIQYSGQPYLNGHSTIFAWNQSPIKLYGTFEDISKNKECDLYLTMTDNTYTQLIWKIMEPRGLRPSGFQYGFTLPVNLTLLKQ